MERNNSETDNGSVLNLIPSGEDLYEEIAEDQDDGY